jgi:hypothetical protein
MKVVILMVTIVILKIIKSGDYLTGKARGVMIKNMWVYQWLVKGINNINLIIYLNHGNSNVTFLTSFNYQYRESGIDLLTSRY